MIANIRHGAPLGLAVLLFAACAPATRGGSGAGQAPAPAVRTINDADVEFMSGMIPHHAQAVLIAGWAESHGARRDVLVICQRIVVGQRDEIGLMQRWLAERGVDVPAADATTHKMKMGDMVHEMLMPGMLNAEQLAELDKSRGSDFDRLLLQAMIGHHLGAIEMVNKLHASAGSGNDDIVYRFSSDVYADQSTEVERMTKMLETIPGK
ncbi:MAG: DUF305 domain-containing protein [Gemmatimonadetes bacterium]|jgi:uncharacterized protein (DUF305 family)|nr:DUF305 domain-containing protein [Gemmatimonadota bacterium]